MDRFKTKFLYCGAGAGTETGAKCFTNPQGPFATEFKFWKGIGANVVCLVRRNAFDWAVSTALQDHLHAACPSFKATMTKRHSKCVRNQIGVDGATLEPGAIFQKTATHEAWYRRQLSICKEAAKSMNVHTVVYEDLVQSPDTSLAKLQRFLLPEGSQILTHKNLDKGHTRKIATSLKAQIKNWDAVVARFNGTRLHHYILESQEL